MKRTCKRFALGLAVGAMWVGAGSSLSAATPPGVDDCEALPAMDFTSIQDAPTQATAPRMVEATGEVPAHCRMDGYVTPNVRIVLDLPNSASWNGKYLQASPGGQGGSTEQEAGWCDEALRRGYACLTHDTGHFGMTRRSSWAYNNLQAELDYGIRGHHVAALAGKAITEHYYGRAPAFSYHVGCSAGGKQGMVQASRFPWNFDGILAQEPANVTAVGVMILWNALASYDADGQPLFTPADLDVLHAGAVAACDADDGLEDGIIGGDPRTCQFDPADLACASGRTSTCLSPVQVEAARKKYTGPVTSTGEKLSKYFPFYPALPGSEKGNYFSMDLESRTSWGRFKAFNPDPGPSWKASDFDWDHDYKRMGISDALVNGFSNPDLRNFKTAGGKLLIIQGWEDSGLPSPQVSIDYYEMAERIMGGRASAQEAVRLFMIPGRTHCYGGVGATSGDYLSALEAWVEEGKAPDMIVGYRPEEDPSGRRTARAYVEANTAVPESYRFTRPHYPYPLQARYKGSGDPNDYRSFEPVDPEDR